MSYFTRTLFLKAGYRRAVLGTTNLSNGKGISVRPVKVYHISVGPNRNGPFHLMYQRKFPEFWVRWKAVLDSREITSFQRSKK